MLDPHLFRNELDFVTTQLKKRNFAFNPQSYSELEARRPGSGIAADKAADLDNDEARVQFIADRIAAADQD